MRKIEDNIFAKYYSLIDYDKWMINKDLIEDITIKKSLKNFILLSYYSYIFVDETPLNIYYNKYYWGCKMRCDYIKKYNNDNLNFEQLLFKIIEEGEMYDNVNWEIIEEIHKEFEL